jgi:hypothetical protein
MGKETVQNLKPFSQRTESEQREIRKKGGIASGKARRERKAFKDLLTKALTEKHPQFNGSNAEAIVAGMIAAAIQGDTKAFIAIRDTIGEKPEEKVRTEIEGGIVFEWGEK